MGFNQKILAAEMHIEKKFHFFVPTYNTFVYICGKF